MGDGIEAVPVLAIAAWRSVSKMKEKFHSNLRRSNQSRWSTLQWWEKTKILKSTTIDTTVCLNKRKSNIDWVYSWLHPTASEWKKMRWWGAEEVQEIRIRKVWKSSMLKQKDCSPWWKAMNNIGFLLNSWNLRQQGGNSWELASQMPVWSSNKWRIE